MHHWKIKRLIITLCVLLMPGTTAVAQENTFSSMHSEGLKALSQEVLANNQSLHALKRRVAALEAEVHAAGTWEDPMIGLGLVNVPIDSFDLSKEPMTQKLITLSQRLPWFGKLDLKSKKAALDAAKLSLKLKAEEQALLRELADNYYELGFVSVSQEINDQLIGHLNQIVDIAASRYTAGKGLQQDVLQAQVEHSRLLEERNALKRQRRVLEERINGLLNRSAFAPITPPTLSELPPLPLSEASLTQTALAGNPELAALQIEMELAAVEVDLARKAYYPDPDLRLSYGQRDADPAGKDRSDFVSGTIVFSLPVWAKQKQGRKKEAALSRREAARLQYQDYASQLPFRISALLNELDQIKANHELYNEALVIQAQQWAESAMIAYQVGKIDFNAMISSRLRVLNMARQEKQYLYQYYRKAAALEEITGDRPAEINTTPSTDR